MNKIARDNLREHVGYTEDDSILIPFILITLLALASWVWNESSLERKAKHSEQVEVVANYAGWSK